MVDAGERSERQWIDLKRASDLVIETWGRDRIVEDISTDEFGELRATMAKRYKSPASLKREMANVRSIFNHANKNGLVQRPVIFGTEFATPSKEAIRLYKHNKKQKHGARTLERDELLTLINAAPAHLKAMILLALNTSCGNQDIAFLTSNDIDLDAGWLRMLRHKTKEERKAWLWPETIKAVKASTAKRRKRAKLREHDNLVFLTRTGKPWGSREKAGNAIPQSFRRLLESKGLYRVNASFYSLRHVFQTIAEESLDMPAVKKVMGHVDPSISAEYREVSDERVKAVCKHVRQWLFGRKAAK